MAMMEEISVIDPQGQPVPRDAQHLGGVAFRGNLVMKGYYRNPTATAEAFQGAGCIPGDIAFHTGRLFQDL